jgi:hypothetical protein
MSDLPKKSDDDIPMLEDIVTPEELERAPQHVELDNGVSDAFAGSAPEYDEALPAMRDDILAQLQSELHSLTIRSVEQAIDAALEHTTHILHKELTQALEARMRTLIEERMEQEFGPREHPHKPSS